MWETAGSAVAHGHPQLTHLRPVQSLGQARLLANTRPRGPHHKRRTQRATRGHPARDPTAQRRSVHIDSGSRHQNSRLCSCRAAAPAGGQIQPHPALQVLTAGPLPLLAQPLASDTQVAAKASCLRPPFTPHPAGALQNHLLSFVPWLPTAHHPHHRRTRASRGLGPLDMPSRRVAPRTAPSPPR